MNNHHIESIHMREILDSRGNPTVEADIHLNNGIMGRASVPSGASTGKHEAVEKRDKNMDRYLGKGVRAIIDNIVDDMDALLYGFNIAEQSKIDQALIHCDGTDNKSRIGANISLSISMAAADAASKAYNIPLYRYLGGLQATRMPVPLMNVLNGGAHANNPIDIQEFMLVPHGVTDFSNALRAGTEIFHHLGKLLHKQGLSTAVGDEGGYAPNINGTESALDLILDAIEKAGYKAGKEVSLALDVAASELYDNSNNHYHFKGLDKIFTSNELVDYYADLCNKYPIISIEDGMDEDDWDGWVALTDRIGDKTQLVGDDLFVTNPVRLSEGIKKKASNSILIKPNQIGTITETIQTIQMAQKNGFGTIMSHRSGETESSFIADLAVATNCGQIKTGSACRSDRMAKYNQLLRIEENLGSHGCFDMNSKQ